MSTSWWHHRNCQEIIKVSGPYPLGTKSVFAKFYCNPCRSGLYQNAIPLCMAIVLLKHLVFDDIYKMSPLYQKLL